MFRIPRNSASSNFRLGLHNVYSLGNGLVYISFRRVYINTSPASPAPDKCI